MGCCAVVVISFIFSGRPVKVLPSPNASTTTSTTPTCASRARGSERCIRGCIRGQVKVDSPQVQADSPTVATVVPHEQVLGGIAGTGQFSSKMGFDEAMEHWILQRQ